MADPRTDSPPGETTHLSPEIIVYATHKNFLNIYDALRIEKCKIEVASYDPATGKQTGLATAWLDLDELRLLIHLVTHRLFQVVLASGGRAPRWEKFGGSERGGAIESRTFLLEWDPGSGGRFAGYPYRLTIANGPGQRTATGAVQPKGDPTSKQAMRLPEADLMEILLAVGAYLRAYEPEVLRVRSQARVAAIRTAVATRDSGGRRGGDGPAPLRAAAPDEAGGDLDAGDAPAGFLAPPLAAPAPRARPTPPAGVAPGPRPGPPPADDPWAGMEVTDTPPPAPARGAHR